MKRMSKKNYAMLYLLFPIFTISSMEKDTAHEELYEELRKSQYDLNVARKTIDDLWLKLDRAQKMYLTPEKAVIEMHRWTLHSPHLHSIKDYSGKTLLFAVKKDYQDLLKELYEDVQENAWLSPEKSDAVITALIVAAECNNLNAVRFFIEKGVDINAVNKFKETSLMFAACYNNYDVACYLLEHGANTEKVCTNGRTALSLAILNNKRDMVSLLLQGKYCAKKRPDNTSYKEINKANPDGYSPEKNSSTIFNWLCTRNNDTHLLEEFINAGATVNPKDTNNHPLLDAIHSENIDAISILLKHTPDSHFVTSKKITPCKLAIEKANPAIVVMLIERCKNQCPKLKHIHNLLGYAQTLFAKETDFSKREKIEEIIDYLNDYLVQNTEPRWEEMGIEKLSISDKKRD